MRIFTVNLRKLFPIVTLLRVSAFAVAFFFALYLLIGNRSDAALCIDTAADAAPSRIVVLDAGHGGEDGGAVGCDGRKEKDLNLAVTLALGERLSELGYTVVYTRTDDRLLYTAEEDIPGMRKISDLKNRCKIAAEYKDALFVSIHMNSFGQAKYSGLQVYYSPAVAGSDALAKCIQSEVVKELQPQNRRNIKRGEEIYILENTENVAVLIECGFLSNPEECKKLSEKEYQKRLSFAIACGMIKYEEERASENSRR